MFVLSPKSQRGDPAFSENPLEHFRFAIHDKTLAKSGFG